MHSLHVVLIVCLVAIEYFGLFFFLLILASTLLFYV